VRYIPTISVVFPARDEGLRVRDTIVSIVRSCESPRHIEIVVVDDESRPERQPDVDVVLPTRGMLRVIRSDVHLGVGAARNLGVRHARGDLIFIVDAHVRLSDAWDAEVVRHSITNTVLAATIRDWDSEFRGYGCSLVVPHMGTRWNMYPPSSGKEIQIASSAGTALERELFWRIGGYDEGMVHYGGFEPEFSVRSWRSGARVVLSTGLEVSHRFKTPSECSRFTRSARTAMIHNCLRFGVVHLPESMILEMVRLHAVEFPTHIEAALQLLELRGAWRRRQELMGGLRYDFEDFSERFHLRDQLNAPIPSSNLRRTIPSK
jgi:glycosyltransferase involved in cell wall biosynthesis